MKNHNSHEQINNGIRSGIRIVNKMEIVMPMTRGIVGRLCLLVTAFLVVVGSIMSFFTMYDINVSRGTLLFYCVIFYLLFAVILNLPGNLRLTLIPVLGIYGFLLYKNWDKFNIGFRQVFNAVYSQAYRFSGNYYTVSDKDSESAELFVAFMLFLLVCLICISVCDKVGFFLCFVFTYPLIELGLYFGRSPSVIYGAMVFIGWIMLLVLSGCGRFQRGGALGFIRRGRDFSAQPGVRFHTAGMCALIAFVLSVLIFFLTFVLSSAMGYKRPESVNDLRRNIKLAASEFSFDDLGESLDRLGASMGLNDNYKIYSNKLGRMGAVNFKNTTELTMNISDIPDDNIYMKGYTGSLYTGHEWTGFEDSEYSDRSYMFSRFDEDDMHPQTMLADYLRLRYPEDMNIIKANIKSKYKNEKYSYIPYGGIPKGKITYDHDGDMYTEDKKDYDLEFPSMTITEDNIRDILSGTDYSINSYYDDYTDFVYEKYLDLPDTDEMQELYDRYVKDSILSENGKGVVNYKCLEYIKELLDENADYSLTPGATPEKQDFVSYFLNETHKGYCVHFATAGVVLARMAGIPARYAEGYVATKDDMENGVKQPDGSLNVSIRDNRGHAWAEIYYYGLGWIPFEFTPSAAAAFDNTTSDSSVTDTAPTENGGSSSTTTYTHVSKGNVKTSQITSAIQQTHTSANTKVTSTKVSSQAKMSLRSKILLMISLAAAVGLIVLILRHMIRCKRRERIFNGDSSDEKVIEAYLSVYDILEYSDASQENMQYMDYARKVSSEHPEILGENEFIRLTELFLKTQLGDVSIDSRDGEWAVNCYRRVFGRLFKRANPIKKVIIRFIKNL